MDSMRKKPYRKKVTSIESSEVYMWLVWILTTKRKSLMRVETCQEKYFTLLLFFYVNSLFRFNPQMVLLSGYIYIHPFNLFCIEPLIVHSYLNDVVLI